MMNIKKLIIIGGDKRQKYMAQDLANKGFEVSLLGFENIDGFKNIKLINFSEFENIVSSFDSIILPLPVSHDNENICVESGQISIDYLIGKINRNQIVFCGMMSKENKSKFFKKGIRLFDYFEREDLKINNAFPTAQGVLKLILLNIPICLNRLKCLVTGCGRTAQMTALMLKNLGADVTLSARKCSDLAWAENHKMNAVFLKDLHRENLNFDVLINTVPSLVLDEKILEKLNPDCLIIEVASKPYGIDFKSAQRHKINYIIAGSLPGKTAPKTAGEIISDTIINIIREGR